MALKSMAFKIARPVYWPNEGNTLVLQSPDSEATLLPNGENSAPVWFGFEANSDLVTLRHNECGLLSIFPWPACADSVHGPGERFQERKGLLPACAVLPGCAPAGSEASLRSGFCSAWRPVTPGTQQLACHPLCACFLAGHRP